MKLITRHFLIISLLTLLLVNACGHDSLDEVKVAKLHYTNPLEQQRLKDALSKAGIHYEIHNESGTKEEIWYENKFRAEVMKIKTQLFGIAPPMGRSISLDASNMASLEKALQSQNVPFRKVTFHGTKFIAWDSKNDVAVDNLLQSSNPKYPEYLTEMRKMRRYSDMNNGNLTHHSSGTGLQPAP